MMRARKKGLSNCFSSCVYVCAIDCVIVCESETWSVNRRRTETAKFQRQSSPPTTLTANFIPSNIQHR